MKYKESEISEWLNHPLTEELIKGVHNEMQMAMEGIANMDFRVCGDPYKTAENLATIDGRASALRILADTEGLRYLLDAAGVEVVDG